MRYGLILKLTFVLTVLSSCAILKISDNHLVSESRYVMGTILDIQLCRENDTRTKFDIAFSIAEELDRLLSNYKPDSKISLINKNGFSQVLPLEQDLYDLLISSLELNEESNGTFDITVGPLIALWEEAAKHNKLPDQAVQEKTRSAVGSQFVRLNRSDRTVRLLKEGMILDTGGIGKGFAVDKIAKFLREDNTKCALVNFGHSSIYAIGAPPDAESWRMMIKFPEEDPIGEIEIKDQALSASYSFGRSFEIANQKYGRLINPQTGQPVNERIQSIVVAESATVAEALSKAVILTSDINGIAINSGERFEFLKKIGDNAPTASVNFPNTTR